MTNPADIQMFSSLDERPSLAQLSQLRAIFGIFAIIFVVKSCISIAEL